MAFKSGKTRGFKLALMGATLLTGLSALGVSVASAQDAAPADDTVVVVTGYRGSLQNSTTAKKRAVGFEDSIFAEDMGKFPDTNLAESFNRIPGITIAREITGEGTTIAIRGLGSSFTRIMLNGAAVATGSTGDINTNNSNREVDLDIFPPELFSQLTVYKSAKASLLEGGASGAVNMRQARPFDFKNDRIMYSVEGIKSSLADEGGYKGSLLFSKKFGTFGVLAGVSHQHTVISAEGWESIGWTNPGLSAAQNPASNRNNTGGGNWTIPGTVPAGAGNGLTTGATIDQALLLSLNPGLTIQQIDNALIPRLARPMHYYGTRDRTSGVLSLEYRPNENMRFWVDSMMAQKENDQERTDINLIGRSGQPIPMNMKVDRSDCSNGCVVTEATLANAQYFLEYRPWLEKSKFASINPGFSWQISDTLKWNVDANYTIATFRRDSPTVLVVTKPNSGLTVKYTNNLVDVPVTTSSVDLNDPKNFQWNGGRLNMQSEARQTQTRGLHTDLTWGTSEFNIQVGFAYDDTQRKITPYDNTTPWSNLACGNNPTVNIGGTPCRGDVITGTAAQVNALNSAYSAYPGYGTGYTAGATGMISYQGSAIPQSELANYLTPGPFGYINVDWDKFTAKTNYYQFLDQAPPTGGSNISSPRSYLREKVEGAYIQVNGDRDIMGHRLRYDLGIRAVTTTQIIGGQSSFADPRNTSATTPADGGRYPNIIVFSYTNTKYKNYLPSANFALNVTDNLIARVATSTTMTRPNPSSMLPGLGFGDPSAFQGTLGNASLTPYISENWDFGLEYYTGKEGYIALTAFNKKVNGFTTQLNTTYPFAYLANFGVTYETLGATQKTAIDLRGGPATAQVSLAQQVNVDGLLNIDGLEFSWVQPLGQWWDALEGFGYSTNYTQIKQKGTGAAPAIALGVPETTWNFTAFYEKGGYSIRLSDTYRDGSQASNGNQNGIPNAKLYNESYEQMDLSASVDLKEAFGLGHNLSLSLNVTNLNDATMRQNFQFESAPNWYYKPGTTYMLGVRGSF
ncbi:tonB-dependent receptor family protein [Asticcacaulis biprosthecium C19]|uniref:TonB-dependent receptor family protein n=1 Tax=Asticcacaulis biprosthecium C19 TaxID=715226 RepID=F4QMQ5_9CAUL|nr:TonB-dependent receptor [Asticcacaulis biprosthecium]EGF91496.1 tonB-dependent receptor family protein [Asticcacaulis biprosthecium C19]